MSSCTLYLFFGISTRVWPRAVSGIAKTSSAMSHADTRRARRFLIAVILSSSVRRGPDGAAPLKRRFAQSKSGTPPRLVCAGGRAAWHQKLPPPAPYNKTLTENARDGRENQLFRRPASRFVRPQTA